MTTANQAVVQDLALPLVSIVTPCYNAARFIEETLDSVLTQDYPNIEYIVLDDGSTDRTHEVLARYAGRIACVRQANQGENRTVNTGLGLATGAIVSVVNADDPLRPGAVAAAVQFLRERPEVLAAYPDWLEIDAHGQALQVYALPQYDIYRLLLGGGVAMGPGVFIRRTAFELIGLRQAHLKYTGDLDFWYRLSLHGALGHIPALLATHRTHEAAASSSAKGRVMADEVVGLADTVFASPLLPPDLRRRRHRIYALYHRLAEPYCGRHRRARLRHTLASLYHRLLDRTPPLPPYTPTRPHPLSRLAKGLAPVLFAGVERGLRLLWRGRRALARGRPVTREGRGTLTLVTPAHGTGGVLRLAKLRALFARVPGLRIEPLPTRGAGDTILDPSGYLAPSDRTGDPPGPLRDLRDARYLLGQIVSQGWRMASTADAAGGAMLLATGESLDPPAAALAAVLARKPLVLYLFDDYATQWQSNRLLRRWAGPLARYTLSQAAEVVAANPALAREIAQRYGVPARALPCPALAPPVRACATSRPAGAAPRVIALVAPFQDDGLRRTVTAAVRLVAPGRIALHRGERRAADPRRADGLDAAASDPGEHRASAEDRQGADIRLVALPFAPSAAAALLSWAPLELPEYLHSAPLVVLAPDYAYLSGLVRTHDCALLVDRDDPQRLAAALSQLLDDPAVAERIGTNARALAGRDEDPAHAARLLGDLIERQRAAAGAGRPGGCG